LGGRCSTPPSKPKSATSRDGSPSIDSTRAIEAIRALQQAADFRCLVSALSG
jgi:hypothetical protein